MIILQSLFNPVNCCLMLNYNNYFMHLSKKQSLFIPHPFYASIFMCLKLYLHSQLCMYLVWNETVCIQVIGQTSTHSHCCQFILTTSLMLLFSVITFWQQFFCVFFFLQQKSQRANRKNTANIFCVQLHLNETKCFSNITWAYVKAFRWIEKNCVLRNMYI